MVCTVSCYQAYYGVYMQFAGHIQWKSMNGQFSTAENLQSRNFQRATYSNSIRCSNIIFYIIVRHYDGTVWKFPACEQHQSQRTSSSHNRDVTNPIAAVSIRPLGGSLISFPGNNQSFHMPLYKDWLRQDRCLKFPYIGSHQLARGGVYTLASPPVGYLPSRC